MPNGDKSLDPSLVQSTASMSTKSKKKVNKRGAKEKTKKKYTEDSVVTNLKTGETSTKITTQKDKTKTNRRGKTKTKTKVKEKFIVRDADGKVIAKDVKKVTSRNGKTRINRNRARVTQNFRAS
tara:strand:+ start:4009 stop:4380 length:372 start_codon:yes stop_codon:yes gene_type:complete